MRAEPLNRLAQAMIVDAGVAPAASLAVAGRSRTGWRFTTGAAGMRSGQRPFPVNPKTPFDLASVTKPIVASTVARLIRRGLFGWETPVSVLLPELAHTATGPLSIELLLSHRAGVDAHRALYSPLVRGEMIDPAAMLAQAADARRADCPGLPPRDGFPSLYSDLGYLLAGAAAARAAGQSLRAVIREETCAPLGVDADSAEGWAAGNAHFVDDVAPTEIVAWRGGEIAGLVHDENAWAYSGSAVSGHAGLFGTAEGLARFGAAMLDALAGRLSTWLTASEASVLTRPRPRGTLRAGFDGRAPEGSAAGTAFGPNSFGHLGFTGTSLWCDPESEVVAVILTNRVNPTRDNLAIRRARPLLNDALFAAGAALGQEPGGGNVST
jgi:CubicO group peptidase (beta-lactamase class C family)